MTRIDRHLAIENGRVVCRSCDEAICDAEENYKLSSLCERKPLTEAGPLVNDPTQYVDDEMEFRQFYCPGCGTLLENEVIEADHDPVHDKELFVG
jgi:N-methylhydantoinase B